MQKERQELKDKNDACRHGMFVSQTGCQFATIVFCIISLISIMYFLTQEVLHYAW